MSLQNTLNHIRSSSAYLQLKDDIISFYDDIIHFGLQQRLSWIVFWSWIYNPTRRYYVEKMLNKDSHEKSSLIVDSDSYLKNEKQMQKSKKNDQSNKIEPELSMAKMRFFPYDFYLYTSLSYNIYGFFQSIILIIIQHYPNVIDQHYNCYLWGRISLNSNVVLYLPYAQIVANFYFLVFRYWIVILLKAFRLDCILFIFAKEEDLKKQLNKDFDKHTIDESWPIQKPTDNYLKDILYIEVEVYDKRARHYFKPNGKQYFLRPNRTLTAHKSIIQNLNNLWFWTLIIYWGLFIPIQPNIVDAALWDVNYLNNYPTCSPDLEELKRKGQLSRWSVTLSLIPLNHRLLAGTFDVINNCIFWGECLCVVVYPTSLAVLLAEDLIAYWKSIKDKLYCLQNKLFYYIENGLLLDYTNRMNYFDSIKRFNQKPNLYRHAFDLTLQNSKKLDHELNEEVILLQRQIMDFFSLLKSYDRYINVVSTAVFIVAISLFVAVSYLAIGVDNTELLIIFRGVQFITFATLSLPIFGILRLRDHIVAVYPLICKIMAHEKSPRRQLYWKQILEFYTNKSHYCFCVFKGHPIDWMTYLNAVATSISCLVVFETYVRYRITTKVS